MLQNAYLLAKIGADTAENEQPFAEIEATEEAPAVRERERVEEAVRVAAVVPVADAAPEP